MTLFSRINSSRFVLNGLSNANEVLGGKVFDEKKWEVVGEYVHDENGGRHQAFYSPRKDTVVLGHLVRAHERIKIEQSLKYSAEESQRLWETSGLVEVAYWSKDDVYGTWAALPFLFPNLCHSVFSPVGLESTVPAYLVYLCRSGALPTHPTERRWVI